MKHFVYVLINYDGSKTYTGSTYDLERRLLEHNLGKNKSSKPYIPYEILFYEAFDSLVEANRQEKFYKTTTGRRKLKLAVENWNRFKLEGESAT